MAKVFTRTVTTYLYPIKEISMKDGKMETIDLEPIVSIIELTRKRLLRICSTRYPNANVFIGEPNVTKKLYSMDLETFLNYATEILE